jgi:hypothetical protein
MSDSGESDPLDPGQLQRVMEMVTRQDEAPPEDARRDEPTTLKTTPLNVAAIRARIEGLSDLQTTQDGPRPDWVADQATALLGEVDRLRRLLERVVVMTADESATCPNDQGECWWCNSNLRANQGDGSPVDPRTDHAPDCPWPEMEAAVRAWKRAEPDATVLAWHPQAKP